MNKTHVKDFTSGNITSQLLIFALPLFLSNLLQVVYNMVDMVVVGKVLGDALAGFTPFLIGIVFYFTGLWKKSAKKNR